jgi:hypothetical protein
MDTPVFEAVHFSEDVAPAMGTLAHVHASHVENQVAPPNTDATEPLRCGAPFVMTTRGSSLRSMQARALLSSPTSFHTNVAKELPARALAMRPPHHRAARVPSSPPHLSARLAKKMSHRILVVVAAQNALMKKLGLTTDVNMESKDFNQYIELFRYGLSEGQVWMIDDLFMNKVPAQPEVWVEADE